MSIQARYRMSWRRAHLVLEAVAIGVAVGYTAQLLRTVARVYS